MFHNIDGTLVAVLHVSGRLAERHTEYEVFKTNEVTTVSLLSGVIVVRQGDSCHAVVCRQSASQSYPINPDRRGPPSGWPLSSRTWNRLVQYNGTSHPAIAHAVSTRLRPEEALQLARHEDGLVNDRTGWFVSTQGLLFAALAFAWKEAAAVVPVFAVLGLVLSMSASWAAHCSNRAFFRAELHNPEAPGFSIMQAYPRTGIWRLRALPWNAFPTLFMVAWLFISLICLHRFLKPSSYRSSPTEVKIVE